MQGQDAKLQGVQGRSSAVARADEELLASLGYKQEFQRAFTGVEVRTSLANLHVSPNIVLQRSLDLWYRFQYHRSPSLNSVSAPPEAHSLSI